MNLSIGRVIFISVVTVKRMCCNVRCPFIGRAFDDDWELTDPTGKTDDEFKIIIKKIEEKILKLKDEYK